MEPKSQWEAGTLGALKLCGDRHHSKDGGEHTGRALVGGAGDVGAQDGGCEAALLLCNFVDKQQK